MQTYIRLSDGAYPVGEFNIRLMNPNTSFPVPFIPPEEYAPVLPTPLPDHNAITQVVREIAPELTNKGHWEQRWEVVDLDADTAAANQAAADEQMAKAVRADRNRRLSDTDWTQVADAPVDKAAWATYRQALRDVTAQAGFPWSVTWPDQPA